MTIAPMTAQDMNAAAEIPAMPFMRPEDEELETLRSDICGVMYDMFDGIAPLHSLLRFVANTRVVSPRTEEGILRMVNAVTTTRMEAGECIYLEDDGPFNSFADEMRHCVSHIAVPLAFNLYANKSAKERVCQYLDSLRNNFGLFGQDVLEIWCRRRGINIPQTYERQVTVLEYMVEDGFKPFMQCIEFACLDMNESFGIF